jgi:hypothetical protein
VRADGWGIGLLLGVPLLLVVLAGLLDRSHGHTYEPLEVSVRLVADGRGLGESTVALVRGRARLAEAKTDAGGRATIASSVCVTRYWSGPELTGTTVLLPEVLIVEHARFGRKAIAIDPATPPENGEEPGAWSLDLGTIDLNAEDGVAR